MRDRRAVLVLAMIVFTVISPPPVLSQSNIFSLENVSFRSSAGTDVYPGSQNARLVVGVKFLGSNAARSIQGCLDLPGGFTTTFRCVRARDSNGSYITRAEYGDVVYFIYTVDVARSVTPGTHLAKLNVSAWVDNSFTWELIDVELIVSPYPELRLELVDSYWSPEAYPGTSSTSLVVILRTTALAIDSAEIKLNLPQGFYPHVVRTSISGIGKYSSFTIVASGIDISPSLAPGTYQVLANVDAVAITDDGVRYNTTVTLTVPVSVGSPPPLLLEVVSYGWVGIRVPPGSLNSDYRVVLRLTDTATINSLVAKLTLPSCARFSNGSRSYTTFLNRPVNYGEIFELTFSGISAECYTTETALLTLEIFASRDGSEFWVTQSYNLLLVVQNPSITLRIASAYWSPEQAFPGSSSLTLTVVLENYDYVSVFDGIATLASNIIKPGRVHISNIAINPLSRTTLTFRDLSIDPTIRPGTYTFKLVLNALVNSGNTVYEIFTEFSFQLEVGTPPTPRIEVVSYGWVDGKAFSTSINNALRVILRNSDPSVIVRSLKAVIDPPKCFRVTNLGNVSLSNLGVSYGGTVTVEFNGIDISCVAGIYLANLTVEVLGEMSSSTFWQSMIYRLPLVVDEPVLNMEIVDSGWVSGIAYSNSSRLTPYIVLLTFTRDYVRNAILHVRLVNAVFAEGGKEATIALGGPIQYGSTATARLPAVNLEGVSDFVVAEVDVLAVVQYGQTIYNASSRFEVKFPVVSERNLAVSEAHIEFNGLPSPLLPAARGVTLSVTITNVNPEPLKVINLNVSTPRGLIVRGVSGDCLRAALPGGGSCVLDAVLDVSNDVFPSTYTIELVVSYGKEVSGAMLYGTEKLFIPVVVEPLEPYIPTLEVISTYWGTQQPVPVYPNSRYVPLTVLLQNIGRYEALGVTLRVRATGLSPIVDTAVCAARLSPGSSCLATLYFNIPPTTSGFVELEVLVRYYITSFGTYVEVERNTTTKIYIEMFPGAGSYLKPVSWGWLNNYNIFPRTENATFTVTVANRLPYPVAGIIAELYLPKGFRGNEGEIASTYFDGPLRSYSSTQLSFRVSVGDVTPGTYNATLRLDYVAQTGGPGVRIIEEHQLNIIVIDDANAVEVVSSSWVEGSAEPGSYGALLYLIIRDKYVDSMSGVYLELTLPDGFLSSLDNTTIVKLPPISPQVIQRLAAPGGAQIGVLTSLFQQMSSQAATYRRGDLVEFVVPLNLLINKTGYYYANATLHYIDQWGTPRTCHFRVPIAVLGGVKYILVEVNGGTVRVASRFTSVTLRLKNFGSGPAHNIYVTIFPYSQLPVLIATPAVHYIEKLDPGREVTINLTVAYNPMGIYVTGAQTVVSYGTVPLIVGIVYRDTSGRIKSFNTSLAVIVEPFIDLVLHDSKASLSAGTLRISGTLVNYGSATAYRVSARVCPTSGQCSESFVGDVEPGAQRAFTLSVTLQESISKVKLTLAYYNAYNELQQLEYEIPVYIAPQQTQTTISQQPQYSLESWTVVAAVVVFLALAGYAIYRAVISYQRKLRQLSEVPPP